MTLPRATLGLFGVLPARCTFEVAAAQVGSRHNTHNTNDRMRAG
jgi:hypothetical protein